MATPRILLVGNYAPDRQFSMFAYADMLCRGLREKGVDVRLIVPAPIFGRLPFLRKWFGYLDKFCLFLPRLIRETSRADLVHICDHSNAMYMRWVTHKPHLLTCHDLFAIRSAWGSIPENQVRFTGRVFQKLIFDGIKRARHVVAVSDTTRHELIQYAGLGPEQVKTIENGLNYPYRPITHEEALPHLNRLGISPDQPYVLHVGGVYFYKNHTGLLKIFAQLKKMLPSLHLVTVGATFDDSLNELAADLGLGPELHHLASLSNEELQALYSRAEALIFPSLMEGFGWPVIEAQACGCPVFAANRGPMPELGGSASVYIDPTAPEEAARTIFDHWAQRATMRTAGLENVAARFLAAQMIDKYLENYARILGESLVDKPAP